MLRQDHDVQTHITWRVLLGSVISSVLMATMAFAQDTAPVPSEISPDVAREQEQFFETSIRPLLVEHCYECHDRGHRKGSLSLESREDMLVGGDSGPALVAGDPDASVLMQALRYQHLEMPPSGRLPPQKIETVAHWIRSGAAWPASNGDHPVTTAPRREEATVTDADRAHWAFQPLRVVTFTNRESARHPIDALLARPLAIAGIEPNERASTPTLVRRLYLGLTGLPPTMDELSRWTERLGGGGNDRFCEQAYAELVDELLQRPAYGEHWARHWLDVVRFAQSNGYERDGYKPNSWRYRDYVVRSLLDDKPYDRFVLEQLAGDELPDSNGESRTATAFYRLGVWDDEPDDKRQAEFDELDDILVTIGASFMGLTIGCARCHDHKFDPIPQEDYYRLLAYFRNVRRYENPAATFQNGTTLPISDASSVRHAYETWQRQRAPGEQAEDAARAAEQQKGSPELTDHYDPTLEWTLAVREHASDPPATHVLIRGSASQEGKAVEPRFLQVLNTSSLGAVEDTSDTHGPRSAGADSSLGPLPSDRSSYSSESQLVDIFPSSGRRLAFARWLVDPRHPLTARVIVNRVWHYHFGRGIVGTTGDFGVAGERPSHPELLDWLAHDFMEHGWSIKHLHRRIVTSEAYRRSSALDVTSDRQRRAMEHDPANRLLWRYALRRLDAEVIRDRMLFSSGELNRSLGGREFYPQLSGEVLAGQSRPGLDWEPSAEADQQRRSLYAVVKRSVRDPLLEAFDYANATSPLTERPMTTVAPQALILLHGRFTADRARALAMRVMDGNDALDLQIAQLFREVLQRDPTPHERAVAVTFVDRLQPDVERRVTQLSFRPDVPVSLYGAYRQRLNGSAFMIGPDRDWSYHSGVWGGAYEGIEVVAPRLGPFALAQHVTFRFGTIEGLVRWDSTVEHITWISQGRVEEGGWRGVGVTFDRLAGGLETRDRTHAEEHLRATPMDLASYPPDTWLPFRWELNERSSRFWLGDTESDVATSEQPLTETARDQGQLGIAVWGGQVDFDRLTVITRDTPKAPRTIALQQCAEIDQPRWIRQQSLASLAQILFNLNEFVFVE